MKVRNGNKVKSIMVINTEGVHNLRMAIILQAVRDYKSAVKGRYLAGIKPDVMRYRCEDFFQSDWFMLLSNGDINGEYILNKLNKYSN